MEFSDWDDVGTIKEGVHALRLGGEPNEGGGTVVQATSLPGDASLLSSGGSAILSKYRGFK